MPKPTSEVEFGFLTIHFERRLFCKVKPDLCPLRERDEGSALSHSERFTPLEKRANREFCSLTGLAGLSKVCSSSCIF